MLSDRQHREYRSARSSATDSTRVHVLAPPMCWLSMMLILSVDVAQIRHRCVAQVLVARLSAHFAQRAHVSLWLRRKIAVICPVVISSEGVYSAGR